MSPKCVQIGSEHSLPAAPWLSRGGHVSHKTCAANRHVGTSISRPPRLAPHPKAPHPMTPARACRAHVWHHILGFKAFLLRFFAPPSYPALVRSWGCFGKLLLSYLRLSSSTSRAPVTNLALFVQSASWDSLLCTSREHVRATLDTRCSSWGCSSCWGCS